ncbi:ABC transporter permease [Geoglobus sp.]
MAWEYIADGLAGAVRLVVSGNAELMDIAFRSVKVSGIAAMLAAIIGVPLGVVIGVSSFRGKNLVKSVFNAMLGIPTVVMGLILYLFLAPAGPLGMLGLLYTEMGISFGQMLLILPIIVSFTANAIESVEGEIRDLVLTLGASRAQAMVKVVEEAMSGIALSVIAAFNRAIAELGIALMVGGNIFVRNGEMNTRVLTTSIQMYVARGEIEFAIALGTILLAIVFAVTALSNYLQRVWAHDQA